MEPNLLITNHLKELNNSGLVTIRDVEIYLFGSYLYKDEPKDIDILVLYPRKYNKNKQIFLFIDILRKQLEYSLKKCIDIQALTYKEEKEVKFIASEKCVFLYRF